MAPPKVTTLPGRPGAKPKVTTLPGRSSSKPKVKPLGKTDLPNTIDEYLHSRGSPMSGLGSSFVQAGRRYGVDPRLLVGIGVIESGAGKYTKIPHNFANWGVHSGQGYGSYEEAINDLARGLRKGYLSKGLNTPDKIVQRYAPGSDGNDTSRWASVVSEVMQTLGGNPRSVARRPQPGAPRGAAPRTAVRTLSGAAGRPPAGPPKVSYQGGTDATALAQALLQGISPEEALRRSTTPFEMIEHAPPPPAARTPPPRPAAAAVDPKAPPPSAKNGLLQAPTSWSGTHVTDGLGWGTKSAEDIMAKPGTGVGAPESGTIEYFHPTGAQGGGSMLFHADSGHTYWLGHIDNGLTGGHVERGQPIAVISSDHPRPHLHIDRK